LGKGEMMIKTIKKKEEIEYNEKYCDECGAKIRIGLACCSARCEKCNKDLCEKCVGHEESTYGDYREVYCKSCWAIGKEYVSKIELLRDDIGKLYEEWKIKCLEKRKNDEIQPKKTKESK
jgi:hypothetical protein